MTFLRRLLSRGGRPGGAGQGRGGGGGGRAGAGFPSAPGAARRDVSRCGVWVRRRWRLFSFSVVASWTRTPGAVVTVAAPQSRVSTGPIRLNKFCLDRTSGVTSPLPLPRGNRSPLPGSELVRAARFPGRAGAESPMYPPMYPPMHPPMYPPMYMYPLFIDRWTPCSKLIDETNAARRLLQVHDRRIF